MNNSVGTRNPRLMLIEDRLGASLAELVSGERARGIAWRRIAIDLQQRTGVDVTGEALRLWFAAGNSAPERAA